MAPRSADFFSSSRLSNSVISRGTPSLLFDQMGDRQPPQLFAVLHDSRRQNEVTDPEHAGDSWTVPAAACSRYATSSRSSSTSLSSCEPVCKAG